MAKSCKDFAFKTTAGKDLEIDLTGLKCTMKQKFVGKLKTSHSSASSRTLQPRNQLCYLLFFTMILVPASHFTIHRGISNVPVMNLSSQRVKHPGKHQRKSWLWGIHSPVLVLVGSVTAVLIQPGSSSCAHLPPTAALNFHSRLPAPGDWVHNPESTALQNTRITAGVSGFPLKWGLY